MIFIPFFYANHLVRLKPSIVIEGEGMMETQENIRLLKLIDKGSETAFNEFYEAYVTFVLQIATQILSDQIEAEDITHEIFLEVYEKPRQYKPHRGSIKAWLAVKTRSRCIDRLRKKQPVLIHKLEQLDTADAIKTEQSVLNQIEKETILRALEQLPAKQREVIYLAYFENKTQVELAESLDRPLGTIKSLVRYGLKNLRKQKDLLNWIKIR